MRINKKVPAFTLIEVTVAMLIAAIAIAITFTAFKIVNGSYLDFNIKQNKLSHFITADKLLKKDFNLAQQILRSEEGSGLVFKTQKGIVEYRFEDQYFTRNQFSLQTDTFKMKVDAFNCRFEGEKAQQGQLIDQLSFQLQIGGFSIPLHYQKLYSAQDLFQ